MDGALLPKRGICSVRLVFQHLEKAVDPRMRTERTLEGAGDAPKWMFGDLGIRREWLCRYRTSCRGGGELQRFCIVRALVANPRYLVARGIGHVRRRPACPDLAFPRKRG